MDTKWAKSLRTTGFVLFCWESSDSDYYRAERTAVFYHGRPTCHQWQFSLSPAPSQKQGLGRGWGRSAECCPVAWCQGLKDEHLMHLFPPLHQGWLQGQPGGHTQSHQEVIEPRSRHW